jgi:hypothetical protein
VITPWASSRVSRRSLAPSGATRISTAVIPRSAGGASDVIVASRVPGRGDQPGGLDAHRHRRAAGPGVPAARADELVPVAHPARLHVEQHLVSAQRARLGQVDQLGDVSDLAYTGGSHAAH